MSELDVDVLCSHMYQLSMNQLRSLEDDNVIPGLQLRDAADRDEACNRICATLESCEPHQERIRQLAAAYCWLFPRDQSLEWALFILDKNAPPVEDFTLQTCVATKLSNPNVDLAFVPVSLGRSRFACVITAEPESDPKDAHVVVGMCAWQDLPYLATCLPGGTSATRIELILEKILKCKSDDMYIGSYAGIDETLNRIHCVEADTESDSGSLDVHVGNDYDD